MEGCPGITFNDGTTCSKTSILPLESSLSHYSHVYNVQ